MRRVGRDRTRGGVHEPDFDAATICRAAELSMATCTIPRCVRAENVQVPALSGRSAAWFARADCGRERERADQPECDQERVRSRQRHAGPTRRRLNRYSGSSHRAQGRSFTGPFGREIAGSTEGDPVRGVAPISQHQGLRALDITRSAIPETSLSCNALRSASPAAAASARRLPIRVAVDHCPPLATTDRVVRQNAWLRPGFRHSELRWDLERTRVDADR